MDSGKIPVKLVKVTRVLGRTGTFFPPSYTLFLPHSAPNPLLPVSMLVLFPIPTLHPFTLSPPRRSLDPQNAQC